MDAGSQVTSVRPQDQTPHAALKTREPSNPEVDLRKLHNDLLEMGKRYANNTNNKTMGKLDTAQ
jgi:hypothetical protein